MVVESRDGVTGEAYELQVPAVRWTNSSFNDIERIFMALRFQTDGLSSHLSSRVRVAPSTSFLCRWTDAPEDGQLYAEPPGDVLFPSVPLNAGALHLIKSLDAASSLKDGIRKLALTESLPAETLYPQIEGALVTGLTRGILSLIPRPNFEGAADRMMLPAGPQRPLAQESTRFALHSQCGAHVINSAN